MEKTMYLTAEERAALQMEKNRIRMEQVRNLRKSALEKDVQKAILQFLALKKIWAIRQNTGAIAFQRRDGSKGYLKAGVPGMADIQAWTAGGHTIWIEVKSSNGKQTDDQKEFQRQAEKHNHVYILARDVSDLYPLFGGVE